MNYKIIKLAAIIVFTVCWYITSTVNAIATQQLFSQFTSEDSTHEQAPGVISLALLLTSAQLLTGAILSVSFLCVSSSSVSVKEETEDVEALLQGSGTKRGISLRFHRYDMIAGFLHGVGVVCTNIGFGYGSASLVQVIKLLEPIETLLLTVFVHVALTGDKNISKIVSCQKMTATLIIVGGTSMLLTQKGMNPNPRSIRFAIGSGFCMALRNVLKKRHANIKHEKMSPSFVMTAGEVFQRGMRDFASITIMATIPTLLMTLLAIISQLKLMVSFHIQSQTTPILIKAVFFHCFFNMASITVLSLTCAPVHSLLNVGKRIANVLVAALVFAIPLSLSGVTGLVIAAIGAFLYNKNSLPMISSCCVSS